MSLNLDQPDYARALARLHPYVRCSLASAGAIATRIHADGVGLEHLLLALMEDEECGAHGIVLHAFADPETLFVEILAITPGILVVGSGRSLPFSKLGVEALFAARAAARAAAAEPSADPTVTPAHVLHAAAARLPQNLLTQLEQAGYQPLGGSPDGEFGTDPGDDPLFRSFSNDSKKLLGQSCRAAHTRDRSAIGPAHLILAALEVEPGLSAPGGLTSGRARMVLHGQDADDSPLTPRELALEPELLAFLGSLPARAGTPEVLRAALRSGPVETQLLLSQQRITDALLDSVGSAFGDPDPPSAV